MIIDIVFACVTVSPIDDRTPSPTSSLTSSSPAPLALQVNTLSPTPSLSTSINGLVIGGAPPACNSARDLFNIIVPSIRYVCMKFTKV